MHDRGLNHIIRGGVVAKAEPAATGAQMLDGQRAIIVDGDTQRQSWRPLRNNAGDLNQHERHVAMATAAAMMLRLRPSDAVSYTLPTTQRLREVVQRSQLHGGTHRAWTRALRDPFCLAFEVG